LTNKTTYAMLFHVSVGNSSFARRLSGECLIYPMGPKHAIGYNSAESEPIWMKSGTL